MFYTSSPLVKITLKIKSVSYGLCSNDQTLSIVIKITNIIDV